MGRIFLSSLSVMIMSFATSACVQWQNEAAPVEFRGGLFYGRDAIYDRDGTELPKGSLSHPAEVAADIADKYSDTNPRYAIAAEVPDVKASDLPPPSESDESAQKDDSITDTGNAGSGDSGEVVAAVNSDAEAGEELIISSLEQKYTPNGTHGDDSGESGSNVSAKDKIDTGRKAVEAGKETQKGREERKKILDVKNIPPKFIWPVRGEIISSFGQSRGGDDSDSGSLSKGYTDGINIAARKGDPIRAAADGIVVYADDELEGYGNLVIIKHRKGYLSAYAHADSIVVRKHDNVVRGQLIGFVGTTGNVQTPQLHFAIRKDKKVVDPLPLLHDD